VTTSKTYLLSIHIACKKIQPVVTRETYWIKVRGEAEPTCLLAGDLVVFPHEHAHLILDYSIAGKGNRVLRPTAEVR